MLITRKSEVSGVVRTKDLSVTEEQLMDYYERGMLLQNAFPDLNASDREFVKSGITDDEWKDLFSGWDNED